METAQSVLDTKGGEVTAIDWSTTVGEAADLMNAENIGALVVTDGEKAVGIFTERDILTKVVALRRNPDDTRVSEVMTGSVACCRRDTRLAECRAVMSEKGIRHLPVVEDGKLYGLLSSRDVISGEMVDKQDTIKFLEGTIEVLNEYLYART